MQTTVATLGRTVHSLAHLEIRQPHFEVRFILTAIPTTALKDELDCFKQAEKKNRRLEKALATSVAIIYELEKKKQKKKEEQQRLDEKGVAIAEAVALQVLLGEDSDDTCKVAINESGWKTQNYNHELKLFMGGPRACFVDVDGGGTWSFTYRPLEKNMYEPLHEGRNGIGFYWIL
ncbi:uncharacterized protein LOC106770583 [Vigna radiata var. radiata]|uniref:Uncharacterized protein LOC106770583 n=1 Tax=Vigna radiata var. radiata TaxID=3916 RepID=A0A1S3V145_VIGRR|nr:uncharacterized protein LOC106770583 [Vigna radiata var. radiata]